MSDDSAQQGILKQIPSNGELQSARENGGLRDANGKRDETNETEARKESSEKYLKFSSQNPKEATPFSILQYKGFSFFRENLLEIDEIAEMEIREDDIWVCSFPRSGTTLTQELVYLIRTLDFEKARTVTLDARFPILDLLIEGKEYYEGLKMVEKLQSPRFVKSHLPHFMLPEQLKAGKGKIIYTSRNLPDALWSAYQFISFLGRKQPFEKYFKRFMEGKEPRTPWGSHVRQYWDHKDDENILFIKFEETVQDMPGTIRKIAEFLDKELTEEDVRRICEHCSINNMKKREIEDRKNWDHVHGTSIKTNDRHGGLINSGTGGGWRGHVTDEMRALMKAEMEKHLSGSGLTFNVKW